MRGVPGVFLVLVVLRIGHDTHLADQRRGGKSGVHFGLRLFKIAHLFKEKPDRILYRPNWSRPMPQPIVILDNGKEFLRR